MRNVIVTGGEPGLGLGIARKLVETGFQVIAVARKENDELAAAMRDVERVNPERSSSPPLTWRKSNALRIW